MQHEEDTLSASEAMKALGVPYSSFYFYVKRAGIEKEIPTGGKYGRYPKRKIEQLRCELEKFRHPVSA